MRSRNVPAFFVSMISVIDAQKQFAARTLFEHASFNLNTDERYGLVGANGSGKSTFLRILMGEESLSSGEIRVAKNAQIAFLRQDQFLKDDTPIVECAMEGDKEAYAALCEKAHAEKNSASVDPGLWAALEERVESLAAYRLKARASEVLEGLGIERRYHEMPLKVLSGGYKLRVLLAQILLSRADIILLDEPTNHLDILSIRWLEKYLASYKGCLVVISHDRRFLDQVTSHTLDVDYTTITRYVGNYSEFVVQKEKIREQKEAEIENLNRDIAHKQAFVDRFRAKASKARQAQSRLKQIEKIEIPELKPSSRRYPKLSFEISRPSGREVVSAIGIGKSYGDKTVLANINFDVIRQERIAIIGANGVGKSTLLKLMSESDTQHVGRFKWGYEVSLGYFAQDHDVILRKSQADAESWLWQFCPEQSQTFVRSLLGRLLFVGDEARKRVSDLSGGELARLELGRLMLAKTNVLLLDEPTNHLDIEALEALVEALQTYEGTLIFVSHDRYFVSELANRIIEITPSGLKDFKGSFQEYLEALGDDHLDVQTVERLEKKGESRVDEKKQERLLQYEEKKRREQYERKKKAKIAQISSNIEALERRLTEIDLQFSKPGFFEVTPREQVKILQEEQDNARLKIETLFLEWQKLDE